MWCTLQQGIQIVLLSFGSGPMPSAEPADQRYFNGTLGRFWTPDPAGSGAANAQSPTSWNMYAYTRGDPVNFNDPTGNYDEPDPPPPDGGGPSILQGTGDGGDFGCGFGYGNVCGLPCGPDWMTDPSLQGPCGDPCTGANSLLGAPPSVACQIGAPAVAAPPPLPLECDATLDSRPVNVRVVKQLGITHAYWEVQEFDPNIDETVLDEVITAGPTPPPAKKHYLDVWVGPPSGDNTKASATWSWSTGFSSGNCGGVSAMLAYGTYWEANYNDSPTRGVGYDGIFGPNSNSVAALLGKYGGFSPPKPPGSRGWNYWLH